MLRADSLSATYAAAHFHYFTELYTEDRFQGECVGLNFALKCGARGPFD
jgi:hypothetical protein